MREFIKNLSAVVCVTVLFLLLAFIAGFTPDVALDGKWPAVNDHPTNWNDVALHPNT